MTETPKQMDERRAIAWARHEWLKSWSELQESQQDYIYTAMSTIRASDASAGMVTVPVELLHRAWKKIVVDPFKAELAAEIDAILRQAQEPDHE